MRVDDEDTAETRIVGPSPYWPEEDEPVVVEEVRRARPAPPPPRRAVWPWLLLLAIVLGGIALVWYLTLDHGDGARPVPAVERLREADAVRLLAGQGFDPIVRRRPDDAPEGVVFAQDPAAGVEVDAGSSVELRVSTGPAETTVPSVVGLPADQAEERLKGAGLAAGRAGVFSEEPTGVVVAQDPGVGKEVPRGSRVRINVSRGTGRVTVPDVVGQSAAEAGASLRGAGLASPRVFTVPSAEPPGSVVAQSPTADSEVARGTAIRINVSKGSGAPQRRQAPDVVGLAEDEAVRTLEDAGFTVRIRRQTTDDPTEVGAVIEQDPPGGTTLIEGDEVGIMVGEAPG
jgi:serine/threonine-protein kinase